MQWPLQWVIRAICALCVHRCSRSLVFSIPRGRQITVPPLLQADQDSLPFPRGHSPRASGIVVHDEPSRDSGRRVRTCCFTLGADRQQLYRSSSQVRPCSAFRASAPPHPCVRSSLPFARRSVKLWDIRQTKASLQAVNPAATGASVSERHRCPLRSWV